MKVTNLHNIIATLYIIMHVMNSYMELEHTSIRHDIVCLYVLYIPIGSDSIHQPHATLLSGEKIWDPCVPMQETSYTRI